MEKFYFEESYRLKENQKIWHVTFLMKKYSSKKIELQLHKNRFGELFYHYVTTVST